jgi:hypothetical protein
MENTKKLVCRKCGGEHLTVKCGKETTGSASTGGASTTKIESKTENKLVDELPLKKEYIKTEFKEIEKPKRINITKDNQEEDSDSEKKPRWKKESGSNGNNNFRERKPLHKVKMSNLPKNMLEEELLELLYDWGNVVRMRVLNYDQNSTAYIEFKNQDEADYLVKALDKTPFEYIMLNVERLYD